MKNLIKRPYFGWVSSVEFTRELLDLTIFPTWYEEVTESNRFIYRFNGVVNSLAEDLKREQNFIISQFTFDSLDITKPFYIAQIDGLSSINSPTRFLQGFDQEGIYNDVYRNCKRIEALGEEYIPKFAEVRKKLQQNFYEFTTEESIKSAESRVYIFNKIKNLLLPGEILLGGEEICVTSLGRIIDTETGVVTSELEKIEYETSRDSGYFLLPLLTDLDSIRFYDINDEEILTDPRGQILGFSSGIEQYIPDYDIDQDGYISEDDMNFIRNSEGRNTLNTSETDWRNIYFKIDKDQDGNITASDIALAELNIHGVKERTVIMSKPISGYCRITYLAYPNPFITYATPSLIVRGGTFGYDAPELGAIDLRIADGYIENSSGMVLGMNRSRTEIWTGRFIEDRYELNKVSYKYQSRMSPIAMTSVDEIGFFLLRSNVPGFRVFGKQYAILRIDSRIEKVEISNDLISIDYELPDGVTFTGIQSTNRKDIFRLFTSEGDTFTFKMQRDFALFDGSQTWGSEGFEKYANKEDILAYQRVYNDVDSFAFNFGMNRLPFETNEELLKRIFIKVSDPPNNSIQGMHSNYSLDLALYNPYLYRDIYILLNNQIDTNSEIRLIIDDADFTRYPNRTITIHLNNPTLVENKTSKPVFIDGQASAMIDEVRIESYYILNGNDLLQDRNLVIRKDTQLRLLQNLLLGNTELVATAPDYEEDLVYFKNIRMRLEYTAIDPDGVIHTNAYQNIVINISSKDLISSSKVEVSGAISQIPRVSKTAKYIPTTYSMIREGSKEYIGEERWNQRTKEIYENDTSFWEKTVLNISPFDDKLVSTYIVNKSLYNIKGFDSEVVEVSL
jgi:hypothetical protein